MKTRIIALIAYFSIVFQVKAQTAMPFSGLDCNGNQVDLFADLDSGKAVLLHFYMPNCGSCPPPALKIQAMANRINAQYPNRVKGYAFPYQNSTTCSYSATWVSSNGLSAIYIPMDSGESQLPHYGGFGMPTVVLLGGKDHQVLFSTLSFSTSDTTVMRDKILQMINGNTGVEQMTDVIQQVEIFPNPSTGNFRVDVEIRSTAVVELQVYNLAGKSVASEWHAQGAGKASYGFDNQNLAAGVYFVSIRTGDQTIVRKLTITP